MSARVGLVLVGLVAVLLPTPGTAVLAVAVWSVALVLWRWSVAVQRGVEVHWEGPARVQPGASVVGTITARNRSAWPVPWLEVQLRMPARAMEPHAHSFVLALGARRQRRFDVQMVAGQRGVHEPRQLTWRAADPVGLSGPFGLGTWRRPTVVVPRLAPLRRLVLPARSPLAELPQTRSLFADRTALVGVREYQRGDPLSAIHWPATARTGQLMRTEDEAAAAREVLVCLDLHVGSYQRRGRPPVTEAAVSVAASLLADTIITARQQAGLALSQAPQSRDATGIAGTRAGLDHGSDGVSDAGPPAGGVGAPDPGLATADAPPGHVNAAATAGPAAATGGTTDAAGASPAAPARAQLWPVRGGDRHLHAMLDALARVGLHDGTEVDRVMAQALRGMHAGTTVVVVTGIVRDAVRDAVAIGQRQGLDVTVLTVGSGVEWQSRLVDHVAGSPCVPVAADRALQRLPL